LTSEPLIFDSSKQQITSKHVLATTGYPRYYFRWVEVDNSNLLIAVSYSISFAFAAIMGMLAFYKNILSQARNAI